MSPSLPALSQSQLAALLLAVPLLAVASYAGVLALTGTDPVAQAVSGAGTQAATGGNGKGNNGNGGGNGGGNGSGSANKTFTISGTVAGLAPGVSTPLQLSVHNNASQAIRMRTLTVTAADVRTPSGSLICSGSNVLLGASMSSRSGSISPTNLLVSGNGDASVVFPVRLSPAAGDACKNVTWRLTYTGTADQA